MRFEVVTILVGLTAVEDRAFEFEPAIREPGRDHAETDVTRILQVMRQRRRCVLRGRGSMHECVWSECRLARITGVDKPTRTLAGGHRIARAQLHEQIVWVLKMTKR